MARLFEWDQVLSSKLRIAINRKGIHWIAAVLAHSADSWFWIAGLILIYWVGNPVWKSIALRYLIGILVTACLVLGIKFTIRRKRPEGDWGGIYRMTDPHSFPSGHAARCILIMVLSFGFTPTWLAMIISIWAILVSVARVGLGVHYLSDVIAGMILGGCIGTAYLSFIS